MFKFTKIRKIFFRKNTFLLYSYLFIILIVLVYFPFWINGRTFVWDTDGISQHYPILQYYGRLLRGVLSGKGFPMVDFNIGLGFDTITTLHYYAVGDPISLLSIFMTSQNATFIYGALIILRLYLAGISFIYFCKYWKKSNTGVLLGALIYVFCGYSLYAGVRHPFFVNPMIYMPLILIGLEEVLRRKRPYLLIVTIFISTLSNFYFLYVLTVIFIIYFLFRYFSKYYFLNKSMIGFLSTALRVGMCFILGIGMAAVIFVPVVYSFMQIGRLDSNSQMLTGFLHYNKGYYIKLLQGFLASGVSPGYWVELCFPSITAVSLAILVSNRRYLKVTIIFILSMVALSVPVFGYLMNGFSYVTNRWIFLIGFIVAFAFALTYDNLFRLGKKENIILVSGCIGYGVLTYAFHSNNIVKLEFSILLITVAFIKLLQLRWFMKRPLLQEISVSLLVLLTLGFQGFIYYSPQYNGYVNEFLTESEVKRDTEGEISSLIKSINDDSFYRIETFGDKVRNEALSVGYNDVSGYFSILDGNITTYFKQLELLGQRNTYRFDNFDNRTIMNALANVKYFISTDKTAAPYGYKLLKKEEKASGDYYIFENLFSLPLGYIYDSYMLTEEYSKLSTLEKQNAMLYSVILDDDCVNIEKTQQNMSKGIKKLDFTIVPDQNIILKDKSIKVLKKDATIILEFASPSKAETYLRMEDFDIKNRKATMGSLKVKGEGEVTKYVNVRSLYHNTYFRNDYLINTGYSKKEKSWISIKFPKKETYSYKGFEVYSYDMNSVKKEIQKLQNTTLNNLSIDNNILQGDILMDSSGVMVFSIPYSIGWNAYVDGKEEQILKGNIMNMALPLNSGEHHITLKYETPFLKIGGLISLFSILIFFGLVIYNRNAYKQNK